MSVVRSAIRPNMMSPLRTTGAPVAVAGSGVGACSDALPEAVSKESFPPSTPLLRKSETEERLVAYWCERLVHSRLQKRCMCSTWYTCQPPAVARNGDTSAGSGPPASKHLVLGE